MINIFMGIPVALSCNIHNEECLNEKINNAFRFYSQCLDESMSPLGKFAKGGSPSGYKMPADCHGYAFNYKRGIDKDSWDGSDEWESKGIERYINGINKISKPYLETILKLNEQSVSTARNSKSTRDLMSRLEAAIRDLSALQIKEVSKYKNELITLYSGLVNKALEKYKNSPVSDRTKPRENLDSIILGAMTRFRRLRMYEEVKKYNNIKDEFYL